MIDFTCDYSGGAHPQILAAINAANAEHNLGYGCDLHCQNARNIIRLNVGIPDCDVHFTAGGTITNLSLIASGLRPHECVIAVNSAHIFSHETGAIEATGHRVQTYDSSDGKLKPGHIERAVRMAENEHIVKPRLVYISNASEIGTIYSRAELIDIRRCCDEYGLLVYLDGARLGAALAADTNDLSLEDVAELTDAFTIGGTKNGFLFGEALVITNPQIARDFRYILKQRGGLFAKGFLIGIQFEAAMQGNLFFDIAKAANKNASLLKSGIAGMGYEFVSESMTNQIFPVFPGEVVDELEKEYLFIRWGGINAGTQAIRLITAWDTEKEHVMAFVDRLRTLKEIRF
jgi:threonine aldolase